MSAGFGFSVGDFIAALTLVRDVIDALQESGTARVRYRQLLRQLYGLETALQHVNRLELEDLDELDGADRASEIAALREAAGQCQRSIDDFFQRIQRYHPHLRDGAGPQVGTRLHSAMQKVKWALCHKDDISKLQIDIAGHTESINLLLATIQLRSTTIENRRQDRRHYTLARKIQASYFEYMRKLTAVHDAVSSETNVRIFRTVLSIHHQLLRIPGQVERQPPVFLVDALGRSSPFHLEFIRSAKALISVLEINFEKIGHGAEKIRRNEFAIEDKGTREEIDLTSDWETCFQPGQHVEMSIIFDRPIEAATLCPRCRQECGDSDEMDIDCSRCGISFCRIAEMEEPDLMPDVTSFESELVGPRRARPSGKSLKRQRDLADDELGPYRKVRIRSWVPLLMPSVEHVQEGHVDEECDVDRVPAAE